MAFLHSINRTVCASIDISGLTYLICLRAVGSHGNSACKGQREATCPECPSWTLRLNPATSRLHSHTTQVHSHMCNPTVISGNYIWQQLRVRKKLLVSSNAFSIWKITHAQKHLMWNSLLYSVMAGKGGGGIKELLVSCWWNKMKLSGIAWQFMWEALGFWGGGGGVW